MFEAYTAIFSRLGARFVSVRADSGSIGGSMSEEFHILADAGEDALLVAEDGSFAANVEVCPSLDVTLSEANDEKLRQVEKFATPGLKTIDDLSKATGVAKHDLVKTLFYSAAEEGSKDLKPVCVLVRGSDEANPIKLKTLLGLANPPLMLNEKEVREVTGAWPGSCGPMGLKIPIYMDNGVFNLKNYIVGANEDGFHLKNVNHNRDYSPTEVADLRIAREGDKNPAGAGALKAFRGIEVGHIFYLGTKYSKAMNATYLNEKGEATLIEMGCYGIGVSRTVQAVIEQSHDKDGIIWPEAIAPFHVHICLLDPDEIKSSSVANQIYDELWANGIEVFLDDRNERPGVKFKDADLLGLPYRINIGSRGLQNGEVELVVRRSKEMEKIKIDAIVAKLKDLLRV